ncbi:MAG: type II/IV secretion system protein [Opitutaceae bacterium]|nr:type II/IV secretion system protein [Opitutaceae bacterium]
MVAAKDYIVQLIIEKGLVSSDIVESVRKGLPEDGQGDLVEALTVTGNVERYRITEMLAEEFMMPVVDLEKVLIAPVALEVVSRELAARYNVFPVEIRENVLYVAISDPLDMDGVDSLSHVLKKTIEPMLASSDEIAHAIIRYYGTGEETVETVLHNFVPELVPEDQLVKNGPSASTDDERDDNSDAPIIRLVQIIINEAFKRRASDIHLEPLEKRFRVRYRIDGVLHEVENPPKRLQLAIISRIKIMSNMSIAEKRNPQDGRIQIGIGGKSIDLRVSSLPAAHGESIVMRILDKESLMLGLPELGFLNDDQETFERLITLPDGIILVTGPTGSGKTTTLYGCLNFINQPDRKIITVEDPVEYQLTGINQVPVRPDVGMTFSSALRAILRQAPNIIMIGEIRDKETAEIAIHASLTGHMVFSTLHTNDAPSAVTRLIDIGVKPFLVSTSLRAIMAQRLIRRNCVQCLEPYEVDHLALRALQVSEKNLENTTYMKGAGCAYCADTGYRGRVGIFEIFQINEEIQRMIYSGATAYQLRRKGRESGMRTMSEDGLRKALSGTTTVEEVLTSTVGDVD